MGGGLLQTIYSSPIFFKLIVHHNLSDNTNNASNGSWYPSNFVPFCLKIQTNSINNV